MSFMSKWNKFIVQEMEKPSKDVVTNLIVFDFDKTLFRSPEPPDDFKGNWWASKESLGEPNVPEEPDRSHWFNDTITATEKAYDSKNTLSVMMTGRMGKNFEERITDLLDQNGIMFHELFFNKSGDDTVDFKIKEVKKILKSYPNISIVEFWDDKREHLNKFKNALSSRTIKVKTHKVDQVIDEAVDLSKLPPEGDVIGDPDAFEKNLNNIKTMKLHGFDIHSNMTRSKGIKDAFENVKIFKITDYAYKEILSQIPPLRTNTIEPITYGTQGELYKLSNGQVFKMFTNTYADDVRWYRKTIEKLHSGKASKHDMKFEDHGAIDLDDLRNSGDIKTYADTLYWVTMSEVIPFTTFLKQTKRSTTEADTEMGHISDAFANNFRAHGRSYDPDERRKIIKGAMIDLMQNTTLKQITRKEANQIMSAFYDFYSSGNRLGDPMHTGNIGVLIQHDKAEPTFVIFDI